MSVMTPSIQTGASVTNEQLHLFSDKAISYDLKIIYLESLVINIKPGPITPSVMHNCRNNLNSSLDFTSIRLYIAFAAPGSDCYRTNQLLLKNKLHILR
jgi:hypothetical protein